jgi:rare lipoprotein A
MKPRIAVFMVLAVLAYGCATTAPTVPKPEALHGIASWYGEEFAGRTTANGEIFDPRLLTAAHRTLPFGTVLEVTNPKSKQSVRVRVNDRGPYIGNRVIDLSYAAAQQIGLIEPGVGEVDIEVVRIGSGDREAPIPMEITVAEAPKTASDAPAVVFPLPASEPAVVDRVEVQQQRSGVVTRKQVAADGKTIENVPVPGAGVPPASSRPPVPPPAPSRLEAGGTRVIKPGFYVQAGAFAVESNAKSLAEKLVTLGQRAWIDRHDLFRVRIGPFATREQALEARTSLEANGMSAIIVAE